MAKRAMFIPSAAFLPLTMAYTPSTYRNNELITTLISHTSSMNGAF